MTVTGTAEMREVPGFSHYLVSAYGRVFSRQKWNDGDFRELKQESLAYGYKRVCLFTPGGARKRFLVHRLVAEIFLGKPSNPYLEVRHLDGNSSNNQVSNLAWGTHMENAQDAIKHDSTLRGSRNHKSKLTEEQVSEIKKLLENRRYPGQRGKANGRLTYEQIGIMFGVSKATIANIATRSWSHV